jgi:FlaA1/EpsC-like NDP-sugar epimerase
MHRLTPRAITLVTVETLLIVLAVAVAAWIRLGNETWTVLLGEQGPFKVLVVVVVAQACLYYADLYDVRIMSDRSQLFTRIIQALAAASFILAAVYYWFPSLVIGRGVFIIAAFLVITEGVAWRLTFEWMSRQVCVR